MPKGIPNTKPSAVETEDEILARMIADDEAAKPEPFGGKGDHDGDGKPGGTAPALAPKMVRVKLLKNYRPQETLDPTDPQKKRRLSPVFEIVGHTKPAVVVRNILGKEEVLAPETFIGDEPAPAPKAGVGFADKLWAGTSVRFTADEARYVRANGIGEIEIDD